MLRSNFRPWAVVVTAAALSIVPAIATGAAPCANPVGVYSGTVTRPGVTDNIAVTFEAGGTACLHTVDGLSLGTWSPTGHKTFTYHIKEALIVNGQQTGWVQINQNAELGYHSFTSSGISDLTDLTDNPIGTSPAQISATLSTSTLAC